MVGWISAAASLLLIVGQRHRSAGWHTVLLVLLGAAVAAERKDDRVAALRFAEGTKGAGAVGQRVVGDGAAGMMSGPIG